MQAFLLTLKIICSPSNIKSIRIRMPYKHNSHQSKFGEGSRWERRDLSTCAVTCVTAIFFRNIMKCNSLKLVEFGIFINDVQYRNNSFSELHTKTHWILYAALIFSSYLSKVFCWVAINDRADISQLPRLSEEVWGGRGRAHRATICNRRDFSAKWDIWWKEDYHEVADRTMTVEESKQSKKKRKYLDFFPVEVFDCWIILFNESIGDELNRQCRFSNTTTTQHHHLKSTALLNNNYNILVDPHCFR